jgi:PAS domain S-box-containing protein
VEYFNRRGVEYVGLPAEAVYGWNWVSVVHPDDAEAMVADWKQSVAAGTTWEFECRLRRADGEFRWQVTRALPVPGTNGEITKWVGTLTDIDERRKFEERLAAAQRSTAEALSMLETVLQGAPIGLAFVGRDGRFIRVNDDFAAACLSSPEGIVGRPAVAVLGSIWDQCEAAFRHVLATGEAIRNVPVTGAAPGAGAALREWLTNFFPVRGDGGASGVGIISTDVTRLMREERARTAVLSHVAEGVYTEDAEGRLRSMNRAATRMLGWSESELIGRPTHDLIHFHALSGAPVPADDCPVRMAAQTGRVTRAAAEAFTRKDGTVFAVAVTAVPLRVGSAVEGTAVIFRDLGPGGGAGTAVRVLLVSVDEAVVQTARAMLGAAEQTELVAVAASAAGAVAAVQAQQPHVVVIDSDLPGLDGVQTVARICRAAPTVKVLLLVERSDEDLVLAAFDAGCNGVVDKGRACVDLLPAVEAAHGGGAVVSRAELEGVLSTARRETPAVIDLSDREREVLACIGQGMSNKQVAAELGLSVNTVRNHVQRILSKLNVHSKLEAVIAARGDAVAPDDAAK